MILKNSSQTWGSLSIGLHWLTVILILCLMAVGLIMTNLPNGPQKIQIYAMHKSFGLTVLGLTVLRLLWRLFSTNPDEVENTPVWQSWAAKLTHGVLYVLLFAMPISGWLYNSAAGFPLKYFGLFKLPKLSGYDPQLKELAGDAHETFFYILALLMLMHAGAALKHHYLDKDSTLTRMLPWLAKKT
ncbi:MAG: cytochrome b [Arenimonas sp.]